MRVTVTGGEAKPPKVERLKKGTKLDREVQKLLPTLSYNQSLMLDCGPGSGKTYVACNYIIPWAREMGYSVLYVSCRVAVNAQFKRSLIRVLGQESLEKELTEEGLRKREEFDGVTVLTYQRLYTLMRNEPDRLKQFGLLIFDEVHALLDDAMFVSTSGFVWQHLRDYFQGAIRIYMSGTAKNILPILAEIEKPFPIEVLKLPADYSGVRLQFFNNLDEITKRVNEDKSDAHWLIYLDTIAKGEQFRRSLTGSSEMLNRLERDRNPELWNAVLRNEKFDAKACICTAVIDVGVNFTDPLLRNIVVSSFNLDTIIQFLGRKRRKKGEKVNFYIWCPDLQDVNQRLAENYVLQDAASLYRTNYPAFVAAHVIHVQDTDLRSWLRVDKDGSLKLNPLVKTYLHNEQMFLERLQRRAARNRGDCRFDQLVANALGLTLPARKDCWLDARLNGEARAAFESHLNENIDKPMNDNSFNSFSEQFRLLCYEAFGKAKGGKDRDDRAWGCTKINHKLEELGYNLRIYQERKQFVLRHQKEGGYNFGE